MQVKKVTLFEENFDAIGAIFMKTRNLLSAEYFSTDAKLIISGCTKITRQHFFNCAKLKPQV